jgi:hypothetical protein
MPSKPTLIPRGVYAGVSVHINRREAEKRFMKSKYRKYLLIGASMIVGNFLISLLLAYISGTLFDSLDATADIIRWRETEIYPFPHWLLYIIPRLAVWSLKAEIAFELSQMILWGCNGYLIRRYLPTMKPPRWFLVPLIMNLFLLDPIQSLLGSGSYYFIAKESRTNNLGVHSDAPEGGA